MSKLKNPDPTVVEEDWGIIDYTLSVKKVEPKSEPEARSGISKQTKNIVLKKDEKINIPKNISFQKGPQKIKIHKNKRSIPCQFCTNSLI